jgi:hypothetical protein
MFHAKSLP